MSNGSYCKAFDIDSTPIANNGSVHRTITILVNRAIMAGDMIGLQIPKIVSSLLISASSQPSSIDTVLYSSTSEVSDHVPWSSVFLNMQASIAGKLTQCCIVTGYLMYTFFFLQIVHYILWVNL